MALVVPGNGRLCGHIRRGNACRWKTETGEKMSTWEHVADTAAFAIFLIAILVWLSI